ncbi:MAG: DUF4349 domain-containing protein [Candidatus Moraniibacteriota bacterium]|nr:MAG: DUF4349 domain-containing protein [Candidatus Moranbacteria bacterium]
MNQEFFVKMTKWILSASIGVLVVAVFFVFFGPRVEREGMNARMKNKMVDMAPLGSEAGVSSRPMMAKGNDAGVAAEPSMAVAAFPSQKNMSSLDQQQEQRVIRVGNLSLRVEDAEWAAGEIDRIAARLGGFTSSRALNGPGAIPPMVSSNIMREKAEGVVGTDTVQSGTVVIKVPSVKFNEAIAAMKSIATVVVNETSSASDVTAQFSDLEVRLKNKYAEEEAFTKILRENTGKVSDILEVTRELSRVRSEIEQMETEKKYLESQTDMAEISIFLTEDVKVGGATDTWRPKETMKEAINRLMMHFRNFVDGSIYFLVSVLPFFLLYLLGLFIAYRAIRALLRKLRKDA